MDKKNRGYKSSKVATRQSPAPKVTPPERHHNDYHVYDDDYVYDDDDPRSEQAYSVFCFKCNTDITFDFICDCPESY